MKLRFEDQRPRVTVVHGNERVRDRTVRAAAKYYDIVAVATTDAADEAIAIRRPQVVFCQSRLLMRGDFNWLKRLKSDGGLATIPVVVVTPAGGEAAEATALAAGADDFLSEQFTTQQLLARIDVHLRAAQKSERVAAEVSETGERLRAALMASGSGAYRWDFSTGKVQWDASLNKLMGYPPGQSLDSHATFLESLHPLDRDEIDRQCEICRTTGSAFNVEYRLRKCDGTYVWLHDRATTVRDAAGKPRYLAGACMDVSEAKRDELRRQFILQFDEALRPLTDAAEITATAARLLGTHLDADRCVYADVMSDEDSFEICGNYCRGVVSVTGSFTFRQFGEALLMKMRANEPQIVDDVHVYYSEPQNYASYDRIQTRASICVPLHKNGRLVGAMAVHQRTPRQWSPDEVELTQFVVARCWESMERARVSRSLQESEKRFRQLANLVPMMVWESQPDGTVDYFNDRWYEFTGFDRNVKGDLSWSPVIHPDDSQNVHDVWYRAVRDCEPYQCECRLMDRRSGEYRWFMGRALPVKNSAGEVVRWFGTTTDIHDAKMTEQALRQSEDQLRAIIEATPECVKIVARDGRILQMNASGLEVLGAETESAVSGHSILEFVAPEYRQSYLENHEKVCMGESRRWEFEVLLMNGARRWMETHAVPMSTAEGEAAQLAITRDITRRKLHEAEREQLLAGERAARAEAEQASRIKDEFLASLSHELRTPLNTILGYATLASMSPAEEPQLAEAIDAIERNARLQARLIEDLLDMHRIVSGNIALELQPVDLTEVVEAAVEAARPAADAKGVAVRTVVDPLSGPARCDPLRVHQVVANLLANAVKFTPSGGQVKVLVERVDSHIDVTVADTGEGIDAAFLPHVFDRFRQADSATTRKYGGLGLGLSIVKHLVELHGGSVSAASAGKGQGASFHVSFPAAELLNIDRVGRVGHSLPERELGCAGDLTGIQVLAVDDEPDACMLIKRVLERCGAKVEVAHSSQRALQLIREQSFDLVISDIGMPLEDGYDLMRAVRALAGSKRNIPSIALTAFVRSEDRQRAALAGFDTHLAKPIEAGDLASVVANLIRRTAGATHRA